MSAPCVPMTAHVGAEECLDGECDDYLDEDGEPLGIDTCTHLDTEQACETHSTVDGNRILHTARWPCTTTDTTEETSR
ncbi:hypothetical protein F7Q99_20025 [Streptomyces kaniharaensis]|uniref:Uncharacterized protein n=1 Tax=Streptomyces kaniharaensis TaxID=212423 RepID=A0A6N7KV69_9ACTN|nr:hypothetical protein [Streptomyces kaniharaensis]MQS14489.1 hypothetical protein [Streptomyces kaniharaensis]